MKVLNRIFVSIFSLMGAVALSHATNSINLDWDRVTTNSDNSAITDLSGYRLFHSTFSMGNNVATAKAHPGVTKIDRTPANTATETYNLTGLVGGTTYYFHLTAFDTSGNESGFNENGSNQVVEVSSCLPNALPNTGLTGPGTSSLPAPASISISGTATDSDGSIARVEFYEGNNYIGEDLSSPYSFNWTSVPAGVYVLKMRAIDTRGAWRDSATVTVTVTADTTAPTVSVTAPTANSTNSKLVTFSAVATDNVAVSSVQFFLNGTSIGAADLTSPYSYAFNSNSMADGTFSLTARARDAAGNEGISPAISFTVDNTSPTISAGPTVTEVFVTSATITWDTNELTDTQVNYGFTTAYGSSSTLVDTSPRVLSHSVTLTGLTASRTYNFRVRSKDGQNNLVLSGNNTFATNAPPVGSDTTPPVATITSHSGTNNLLRGNVALTASASDNIGVVGVQFLIDDGLGFQNLGAEDTTSPYSMTWVSRNYNDGFYSIIVRARDAAGNTDDSPTVIFQIDNSSPTAPTNVAVGNITHNSARVTWTTSALEQATMAVEYKTAAASTWITAPEGITSGPSDHFVDLSGLAVNTVFNYRIVLTDLIGNVTRTTSASFTTLTAPPANAPTITLVSKPEAGVTILRGELVSFKVAITPGSGSQRVVRLFYSAVNGSNVAANSLIMTQQAGTREYVGNIDTQNLTPGVIRFRAEVIEDNNQSLRAVTADGAFTFADEVTSSGGSTGGTPIVADDGNVYNGNVSVRLPGGSGYTQVTVSRQDPTLNQFGAQGESGIDSAYTGNPISLVNIFVPGKEHVVFNKPATLSLTYRDVEDVNGDGIPEGNGREDTSNYPEDKLAIFWYNNGRWVKIGGQVDAQKNMITAKITHFSIYAIFPAIALESAKAQEKFLSPALADGINDVATFGLEAQEVTIVDSKGVTVFNAELAEMNMSAITWNCRDEKGNIVPSGAYVAKIKTKDGKTLYQSLAVVK